MPISKNVAPRDHMTLLEVFAIRDPKRRAAALFFSHEFHPDDPLALKLAKSVAMPEAGVWGGNVQARLAEMQKAKPRRRRTKASAPKVPPNIFLTLLDLDDELANGVSPDGSAAGCRDHDSQS